LVVLALGNGYLTHSTKPGAGYGALAKLGRSGRAHVDDPLFVVEPSQMAVSSGQPRLGDRIECLSSQQDPDMLAARPTDMPAVG
jgi:hypothetical protein